MLAMKNQVGGCGSQMKCFQTRSRNGVGLMKKKYVVVSEEHVIDGVANFMATCIMNLTPEELQKTVAKAIDGVSKLGKILDIWHAGMLFYTLSTWGLALVGLYKSSAVLKFAALGTHKTSKLALCAL